MVDSQASDAELLVLLEFAHSFHLGVKGSTHAHVHVCTHAHAHTNHLEGHTMEVVVSAKGPTGASWGKREA